VTFGKDNMPKADKQKITLRNKVLLRLIHQCWQQFRGINFQIEIYNND
jgi:hypothetical protein